MTKTARRGLRALRLPLLVTTALAALMLSACGTPATPGDSAGTSSDISASDTGSDTPGAQLAGLQFESVTSSGHDLVPDSHIVFEFVTDPDADSATVRTSAGCNHMGGEPQWDGDTLTIPNMEMTAMGCDSPLMDQEMWWADVLHDGVHVAIAGNILTLTGADPDVTIEFVDITPRPVHESLDNTVWTLESIVTGSGDDAMVSSVPADLEVTLRFVDGQLDVFDGLTWLSAPADTVDIGENTVRVTDGLAGDGIGCPEGETCRVDVSVLASDFHYEMTQQRDVITLTITGIGDTAHRGLVFAGIEG